MNHVTFLDTHLSIEKMKIEVETFSITSKNPIEARGSAESET